MKSYALVLANDIAEPNEMLEVLKQTRDYIDGVKIGITSSMIPGVDVFARAKEIMGDKAVAVQVLADYKVADIGFKGKGGEWSGTNAKIVRTLSAAGTDYITCHTFPGISSIEECVETAHKNGSKVLTLPSMTHKGANLFFGMPLDERQREHVKKEFEDYGFDRGKSSKLYHLVDGAETITDLILILGNYICVDGYIGPGNDPKILNRYRLYTNGEIWSPGFGRQDKLGRNMEQQIGEWARAVGQRSAMIVGSAIYEADDPKKAAREIMGLRDKVIENL